MAQRLFFSDTNPKRSRVYTALDGVTVEGSYGDYSTFPTGFTEVPWPVPASPNPDYFLALLGSGYDLATTQTMSNYTAPTSATNFDPTPAAGPVGDDIEPSVDFSGPLTDALDAFWVIDAATWAVIPTVAFLDAPNTVRLIFITPPASGSNFFMVVAVSTGEELHTLQI